MIPMPLSPERCSSPLFESFWLVVLINGFVKRRWKPSGEHVDSLGAIDIVFGMSYEFLKVSNVSIEILSLHPDPLTKRHARFFFLEGVSELSVKREEATVPKPPVPGLYSHVYYLRGEPVTHRPDPF